MKLATIRDRDGGGRDGQLVVVRRDGAVFTRARAIARTLQVALENWDTMEAPLRQLARRLEAGEVDAEPADPKLWQAPLPRAYEWVDGSAYLNHIRLVRRARGAEPPPTLTTDPLVYQGGSGVLLGPTDDLLLPDPAWGLDFESEVVALLGDTPRATHADAAHTCVRLLTLANDVTYRNLIPAELAKGFGFFCAKPATAFAPFAVTPDELGAAWRGGRVHLPLRSTFNGQLVGDPDAGPEMHFSFFDLVAHITKTRAFTAGTLLGSGTVSNENRARGISCLAEQRTLETLDHGAPRTPFMKVGDRVEIEMLGERGDSIFGRIAQRVTAA